MFWGLVQRSQSPNVSTISFPHSLHKRQGSSSQVASLDSFPWEMGNPISRWRFGHFSRHLIEKGTWVQRKVWGHWLLLGDESREEISHIITFFLKNACIDFCLCLFGGLSSEVGLKQPNICWPLTCERLSTLPRLTAKRTESGWFENLWPFLGAKSNIRTGNSAETYGV